MSAWPLERMRSRMARSVLDRVAGDVEWVDTSGEPWLPEESPVRQVHANAAMLVGGVRALLLQSLHPAAMQAVEDYSGYRSDPWERFRRIVGFMYATTFGSRDQATDRIDHVRRIHDQVTGVMPDGTPYQASDPDLLMWIHVAEVDSILTVNHAYATTQLSAAEANQYVADMAITGEALGVIAAPRTVEQLHVRLAEFRPALRGTPPARTASRVLLGDPPISGIARGIYRVLAAGGVATLPVWARYELGLPTVPVIDRLLLQPAARTLLVNIDQALAPVFQRWLGGAPTSHD